MRVIVQRVRRAQVRVAGDVVGEIGEGLCVLLGVTRGGDKPQIERTMREIAQFRVLRGADGDDGARRSAEEAGTSVLLVSQFTLYAGVHKGRSLGQSHAAPGDITEPIVTVTAGELRKVYGLHVETGKFDAVVGMELINDGPFTLLIGT